ncbi:MAG TPA: hypothetical protein VMU30_03055 [Bacteroidota bacterium]|nr:hypothetical protein [Bacteroidota bacterium]
METITNNTIISRSTYQAVPRTSAQQQTFLAKSKMPIYIEYAKNPLLWAAAVWLTVCAIFVIDVLYH